MATFFAAAGRGLGQLLDDRDTPKGVTVRPVRRRRRRPPTCSRKSLGVACHFDGCFNWRWTAAFLHTSWTLPADDLVFWARALY